MGQQWDAAVASVEVEPGLFRTDLDAGWSVGGGLNGGYLMAVTGSALARVLPGKPDPITFTTHFLSASEPGPADIRTRVLREGGSIATVAADVLQEGHPRVTVLATYGDLSTLPDKVHMKATPFDIAPLEECVSNEFAPPEFREIAPLMDRFEMRFDPGCIGWAVGQPAGRGELKSWFRVEEDTDAPDPVQLLLAVDAMPPVTFDLDMPGWAPTLELTAHLRAAPAPGWFRLRHATTHVAGGMFAEDCEVWDSSGTLVAQSRQLARVPRGF